MRIPSFLARRGETSVTTALPSPKTSPEAPSASPSSPLPQSSNESNKDDNNKEKEFQLIPYRKTMILCMDSADDRARVLERVEVIVSYRHGERILRIVPIPEDDPEEAIPCIASTDSCDDSVLSETEHQSLPRPETTFLEEFARQVLDPCQCRTFLKPALRKEPRTTAVSSNRSVSFDKVDIKEFPMTLGDHPSAATGPPIALNWGKIERERCVALDEYEASRSPRRNRRQLKLSLRDRKGILQNQFSAAEVNKAWQEARAIREQRRETIQRGLMMMFLDDVVETTSRKVGRMTDSLSSVVLCG